MKPSVSIVVPAYNEEGNIEGALASIRCAAVTAGYGDAEIIVVDRADVLTRSTKEQIVAHNENVTAFCAR